MNADSFKDWFLNRFLNYLEEGSIIIMGSLSYRSIIVDKVIKTGFRKKCIEEWLRKNRMEYDPTKIISELLLRVTPYKTRGKFYELDQIANEMGHLVIILPPYHCQYNRIEPIGAKVKREVAQLNSTFR
jgi:hypothetical protein